MSLQPSSQPEARSLIVFLLSVLTPLLTQFTDFQDKVRDLPRRGRGPRSPGSGSGSTSRPDSDHISSTNFQKTRRDFVFQLFQTKTNQMPIFGHGSKNNYAVRMFLDGPKSFFRNLFFPFWRFLNGLLTFDHILYNNS